VVVVFHIHDAQVTDAMRLRADRLVRRLARRVGREVTQALIRFEHDGPTRRVEIEVRPAGRRPVVARAEARYFGPALTECGERLARRLGADQAPRTRAVRRAARSART
jgi:hypothetical protein